MRRSEIAVFATFSIDRIQLSGVPASIFLGIGERESVGFPKFVDTEYTVPQKGLFYRLRDSAGANSRNLPFRETQHTSMYESTRALDGM